MPPVQVLQGGGPEGFGKGEAPICLSCFPHTETNTQEERKNNNNTTNQTNESM